MRSAVLPGKRVDAAKLRDHLPDEEQAEDPEVAPERRSGDVHPAFEEEERRQEGERHHAQPLLLLAVLNVVAGHDEAEDERRKHRLRVSARTEPHEQEERGEDELDLRLDHAVAEANEEPRRDARQPDDQHDRNDDEGRDPERRLDEEDGERGCGPEVGYESRGHDPLPDHRLIESRLDENGVDDRKARRRQRDPRNLSLPVIPAQTVVGE